MIENLPVKVISCKVFDTELGGRTYINFVGTQGTRFFWRASGKLDIPVNSHVSLTGSIVEHREDGSIVLTHCALDGRTPINLPKLPSTPPHAGVPGVPVEPSQPFEGTLGTAWGVVDRGMSTLARVLLVILGLSCLIPFIGMLIGVIAIPTMIIAAIVLLVRKAGRAGSVQYGDSIVSQNLTWVLISLGIAVVCLAIQVGFLFFLSAAAGG